MKNMYSKIMLSLILGASVVSANNAEAFKLSVFHVNDIHSHISSERMKLKVDGVKTYMQIGGYARMVNQLKKLKAKKPNSLILNAGDTFQGTLFYSLFKGKADAKALNLISWDAYALGNHEFDDGDKALADFLDLLDDDITMLAANVVPDKGNILEGKWSPYVIKTVGKEKIGIIGIDIVGKTIKSSNPSDEIKFSDETKTAQKYINELKALGINKIIVLSHQGYKNDLKMAAALSGVDIIVGGDSHSLLGDFSNLGLKSTSNDYPTLVTSKDNKQVCVVQAWEYAHLLGDLDVVFDKAGDVLYCTGQPKILAGDVFKRKNKDGKKVEVSEDEKTKILKILTAASNIDIVEENKEALKIVKEYEDKVNEKKTIVIGSAGEEIGHSRIPGDTYDKRNTLPLGSDIAAIVAKSFYDLSKLADACIQNAGGVRTPIMKGDISMGDAYSLLPFSNTLFEIQMTGSEIKQVLEDAIANVKTGGSTGSFPYSYALKYDVDMSKDINNTVSNLEILNRKTQIWGELIKDKMYTIVTNSYTAGGKDGYTTFKTVQDKRGKGVDTYLDYALSFVKYVEHKKANNEEVMILPKDLHSIKSFKADTK
ncbi:MAG: NAD nucleotidase [Campylobacteraceae bacterium]|nr:NAD nucleotidase [Campylobacteraceae bacterium]